MSTITGGSVYSRSPLKEEDLVTIDRVLDLRSESLTRTRKGRVWEFNSRGVRIGVSVQELPDVLWECEDELLDVGLLPEPGHYRVAFLSRNRGSDVDELIDLLLREVADAICGVGTGRLHYH